MTKAMTAHDHFGVPALTMVATISVMYETLSSGDAYQGFASSSCPTSTFHVDALSQAQELGEARLQAKLGRSRSRARSWTGVGEGAARTPQRCPAVGASVSRCRCREAPSAFMSAVLLECYVCTVVTSFV
jgi:hypothetical protein